MTTADAASVRRDAVLHPHRPARSGRDVDLLAPGGEHGAGATEDAHHRALLRALAAAEDAADDGPAHRASAHDGGVAAVAVRTLHLDGGRVEPVLYAADDDAVEVDGEARLAGHAAGPLGAEHVALQDRPPG